MAILLYRVDERLIHGQVVVGWGSRLSIERIIVVDDTLADSPWEQELYALGLPDEMAATFAAVDDARARLAEWETRRDRALLLTRDIGTMRRLAEGGGLEGREVNIGGIHHAEGRERVLPYLYLGREEAAELKRLRADGAELFAQDLPGSRRVPLSELLAAG